MDEKKTSSGTIWVHHFHFNFELVSLLNGMKGEKEGGWS